LPPALGLKGTAQADRILSDSNSRQAIVLAASPDFQTAKKGAQELNDALSPSSAFESINLYINTDVIRSFTDFLYKYRFALLDNETRGLLESGRAGEIADSALASAYGAFNFSSLDYLEGDPFFLVDRELRGHLASSLASAPSMSVKDDVLASQYDGVWYVMLRMKLAKSGVALNSKESAVQKIHAACDAISAGAPGGDLHFVTSGAPFHSYESSTSAQREISIISVVTSILVVIIFFVCFRNFIPVTAAVSAVALSILTALGAALLFFREVHVLTLVFGTTLIGTCVDYSVHFFIHWKWSASIRDSGHVRSLIFRGITMSIISTAVCFIFLFIAPFIILKQFAVFLLCGLVSSWLTVICIYPYFKKPVSVPMRIAAPFRIVSRRVKYGILAVIAVFFIAILAVNWRQLRIDNNIRSLYTVKGKLLESEITAAKVINTGSVGWYYLVSGKTPDETLENEERLTQALDQQIALGNLGNYTAVSKFIPSLQTQQRNIRAAGNLLPLAHAQYDALGFSEADAGAFASELSNAQNVSIDAPLPAFLSDIISSFWIGRTPEGSYYSAVMVQHAGNEDIFRGIAKSQDNVFFIDKVNDIQTELNHLTTVIALFFLMSYIVIAVIVRFNYSVKRTIRICLVPVFFILVSLSVLAFLDIPIGFFPVVGMILVYTLGLDYIFYITENEAQTGINGEDSVEGRTMTDFAIFLSYVTSALSFGALSLSSFTPVRLFGLTVFTGLTAAYCTAMLLTDSFGKN
ncbi:MAG: MMPL family transporter, partial [Treponema sp.]|nr:MMPL family transporter [Treponema sp.]